MAMKVAINELGTNNNNIVHVSLPANKNTIIDAMDRAKIFGETSFRIEKCKDFPELEGFEFAEEPTLDELNFLAKRLEEIKTNFEFQCAYRMLLREPMNTIGEAINRTYNLETVCVEFCRNLKEYGAAVIQEDLLEELNNLPKEVCELLDLEKVGQRMAERENGTIMNGYYITAAYYEPASVYNGALPEPPEDWIFRLEIAKYSENTEDVSELKSEVLTLPADENDLQKIAESLGEESIECCDCLNFESVIPRITDSSWDSVEEIDLLNSIAKKYSELSREDAVKFKAVLESNPCCKLDKIAKIIRDLDSYEFDITVKNYTDFGEKYLSKMLPPEFDKIILDGSCGASLGDKILRKNGCAMTDYGVVSQRGGHIYTMIESPECEEIQSPEMSF